MEGIRLNKFISDSGICSRREADRMIEDGHVFINGRVAHVGDRVMPGQKVKANGQEVKRDFEYSYIMFNKPVGVVSTTDRSDRDNIVDYVAHPDRVFPIGRLDKDSQGLILMTNNGDIVNKILRAGNSHEKEYIVTVDKLVTDDFIKRMSNGVSILGVNTLKCEVTREAAKVFRIVLKQGLNRQIRRMCEALGFEVTKLERIRIMNIQLGKLKQGEWRNLTPVEMEDLNEMLKSSKKTSSKSSARSTTGRYKAERGEFSEERRPSPGKKSFSAERKNSGTGRTMTSKAGTSKTSAGPATPKPSKPRRPLSEKPAKFGTTGKFTKTGSAPKKDSGRSSAPSKGGRRPGAGGKQTVGKPKRK